MYATKGLNIVLSVLVSCIEYLSLPTRKKERYIKVFKAKHTHSGAREKEHNIYDDIDFLSICNDQPCNICKKTSSMMISSFSAFTIIEHVFSHTH